MAVEPDEQQFADVAAVAGGEADGPVVMLNLNRYRDRGRASTCATARWRGRGARAGRREDPLAHGAG